MDLTGGSQGRYRSLAIRCPGCASSMRTDALAEAEVDVCDGCGGLWVDWFDGEVRAVAAETLALSTAAEAAAVPVAPNERAAAGACPRCTKQLVAEAYRVPTTSDAAPLASSAPADAVDLMRCEECFGVFVSRASAERLAAMPIDQLPPRSTRAGAEGLEPSPIAWERFIAVLRRLLGLS